MLKVMIRFELVGSEQEVCSDVQAELHFTQLLQTIEFIKNGVQFYWGQTLLKEKKIILHKLITRLNSSS